jgi:(1->4)-alpha-D-glucan 1-alpha-D-glucosylmutase
MVARNRGRVAAGPRRVPCASYRLQLQPGFGFAQAAAAVPYLAALGITECYVSPIWKARRGSLHGYDVCDPNVLNDELGTAAEFQVFVSALRANGLGLIVDIVPNHMAADERANRWWRDVLRLGPRSPHAPVFDIDWHPLKSELRGKVLLPILGTSYGEALESGALRATMIDGEPVVVYGDRCVPLDVPSDIDVEGLNGTLGVPTSFDRLHDVLERQAYRLASWRTAAWELNYRRFFNIDHLVGVRVEDARVFARTHELLGHLIGEGIVTGVRVDHPDGLALPGEYFRRLQNLGHTDDRAREERPLADGEPSLYVVIEKILVPGEQLDAEWAVHGTTGYEFLNAVNGLFVARERTRALGRVYTRFVGRMPDFAETVYAAKKQVMQTTFPADLDRLTQALDRLSERDRRSRDITWHALRRALIELVACLEVYRTYVTPDGCSPRDRQRIVAAAAAADARTPAVESHAFSFVRDVIVEASSADPERLRVALRIQQFTGAVFAKAVEDTAFYRDNTLVSLNEVGGNPAGRGTSAEAFHRLNSHRRDHTPLAMSTTSTHDTKLGEDARARLNVLTERARDWQMRIGEWARANRPLRTKIAEGWGPDRQDEYRFYQALVALWPSEVLEPAQAVDEEFVSRLTRYAIKSAREANRHTSWVRQNASYEDALSRFVSGALAGRRREVFLRSVADFVRTIAPAGAVNGLAQVVIKIASPGVPDFYQGTELWDRHLVDPDNRGIVDLDVRRRMLQEMDDELEGIGAGRARWASDLLDRWTDGRIKLFVTAEALRFRRAHHRLFAEGAYHRLEPDCGGVGIDAVAFARVLDARCVVALTPRLAGDATVDGRWPTGDRWAEATVPLPPEVGCRTFRNVFTGELCTANQEGRLPLREALAACPVALLDGVG